MDQDRWRAVSGIVDAALELPPEERAPFLGRMCSTDDLRVEVDLLLRACERSGGFLDGAASALAAPLFAEEPSPKARDEAESLARLRETLASRYAIGREIGRGGMALVYLARDLSHSRQVAVKLLRPDLAAALGAERFLREIEIARRLTHPHILPVLDSGAAQGLLYFVMPFVGGETLRDRLAQEYRLPAVEAASIARDVAAALDHAHRNDVLHRDLKPENVLLAHGHAFLTDFGIACAITRASEGAADARVRPLTGAGMSLGTPAYMSPEQARGSRTLDGRSDIYALGCVLFEMLAGHPPFSGPTADNVIRQHVSARAPDLATVRSDVDAAVSNAVARALSKSPEHRFATMEEFANALTAAEPEAAAVRRAPSSA
ncbi:MAG TPA: serine/threonine-protein kinase [Gemmatimonadaceae bacterium]|nr:serine/threonine-protein kinase [Gemmatimonadaceae bacterium]